MVDETRRLIDSRDGWARRKASAITTAAAAVRPMTWSSAMAKARPPTTAAIPTPSSLQPPGVGMSPPLWSCGRQWQRLAVQRRHSRSCSLRSRAARVTASLRFSRIPGIGAAYPLGLWRGTGTESIISVTMSLDRRPRTRLSGLGRSRCGSMAGASALMSSGVT